MITIIDFGMGNLGSIHNMLTRLGFDSEITSDLEQIESADKLILPGVGAFDNAMTNLEIWSRAITAKAGSKRRKVVFFTPKYTPLLSSLDDICHIGWGVDGSPRQMGHAPNNAHILFLQMEQLVSSSLPFLHFHSPRPFRRERRPEPMKQ